MNSKVVWVKTFQQFIEQYVPVRPDSLVGRGLGPKWDRRVRVEVDYHGEWKDAGEYDDLQKAEPVIRHYKWAGYKVRARQVDYGRKII